MSVSASNATWLAPGCRLDRYDLLLQVAEGGMGLLWLARQEGKHGFDRIVAIKTILPKLASDGAFRRMFLDEAQVASRIEHPNVAQVLDLGEERGVLFMVMEWIDGEALNHVGRTAAGEGDGRIPVGILTRIMVDVCAGLHAAHELTDSEGLALGVVHRDVSPPNLLVGFRGITKVIDFGIAKARNRISQDTSAGFLKGKIAYMPPEQALGNAVDRRTDVWSTGASMYRFLAGHVPYGASEPLAVLRQITEGLPPTPIPTTVPEPIRIVVEKALQPDPAKRFATADEMGVALETAMREADILTTHEDVAAYMVEHFGEARAARTKGIDDATRASRARMRVGRASDRPTRMSRPPPVVSPALQAPLPLGPAASRPIVRWVVGAGLLCVLLASRFAWHPAQHSRSPGAADMTPSSTPLPGSIEAPIFPSAETFAEQENVPALDPSPFVAASVSANDTRGAGARSEPTVSDPGSSDTLLERARRARRAGRIDEAASLFAAAVENEPANSEALTGLAEVDEAKGATGQAIRMYRRAVAVNPNYLPAYLGLADSLWTSGRRDEARAAYRIIVDQFPARMSPDLARERAAGNRLAY